MYSIYILLAEARPSIPTEDVGFTILVSGVPRDGSLSPDGGDTP